MIDNEIPKHRKKKQSSTSKSSTKSKHKHEYKEVLLIHNDRPHWATVCKICGKIGDLHFFETERTEQGYYRSLDADEVFDKYKDLENIIIEDIWQKYVPISQEGGNRNDFKYYLDYSIGFVTRGCFRQCQFCVNKNYKKVEVHSPFDEFVDYSRKKICLLDDNFFGCPGWKDILFQLQATGKPFQFKQGLDERLLTDEKCEMLFKSEYDGDYIFAFDNVSDYELIERKLQLLRKYTEKYPKFYVFCGFDRDDKWEEDFWKQDIFDMFKRIELLMKYHCLPYIMRFNRYLESPYQGVYKTVAAWCNQPSFFKKKSLREFGIASGSDSARNRYIVDFEEKYPEFKKYMDMKW